jgi:hypothetical protein
MIVCKAAAGGNMTRRWFQAVSEWVRSPVANLEADRGEALLPLRKPTGHVGKRRQECWWEPIYAPTLELENDPYDWDVGRDSGPCRRFVTGEVLDHQSLPGVSFKVQKKIFKECDFQGNFGNHAFIMFDDCDFIDCDFAFSRWKDAHFRKCTFQNSSISLAYFDKCEFRDCIWTKIGLASKTDFFRCFLNNPKKLIDASFSGTDPSDRTFRHRLFQWHRLQGTRAHVLRNLLISHQSVGDEHTFYETVKLHELQRSFSRICHDIYDLAFSPKSRLSALIRLPTHIVDHFILKAFGYLNNWGSSAVRPLFALLILLAGFGTLYKIVRFDAPIDHPWQKSFDITFLAGYGNQISPNDSNLTLVQDIHAVLAIVIYTVFFATVVSKLSRAR